ncbi:MAG: transglutaminase domain-containing protein [Phycisphaerales bacterium]|nr:transglutaminase domain-containing protein [Phycisphaerales bacterium]
MIGRSLAAVLSLCSISLGQGQPAAPSTPPTQPAASQPAAPAAQPRPTPRPAPLIVPTGDFLKRVNGKDWTLTIDVNIRAGMDRVPADRIPEKDLWKFDTIAVVFPLLTGTASSMTYAAATGQLSLNDVRVAVPMDLLPGYPGGTRLGKWGFTDWTGEELRLHVTLPTTCWNTVFDEARAGRVGWPAGPWPDEAASSFLPEWYMDVAPDGTAYDMSPLQNLLDRWTNGKDPRSLPPVTLAKWIAGRVQEEIQPSGLGLVASSGRRVSGLEGVNLQTVPVTAQRRRGSEFDVVCLLTAAYRAAGLPARTVIAWDTGEDDDKPFLAKGSSARLRAWTEFYLYDEKAGTGNWIPVDVIRLRQSGSRAGKLDQPWKYFGTHDELRNVIPFAHQFHPPTTVRAYGSPGFWGWLVTPKPPDRAVQTLSFTASSTSKGPGDDKKRAEERRDRGR